MERRLEAILFADVVGYSILIGEDEDGTLDYHPSQLCAVQLEDSEKNGGLIWTVNNFSLWKMVTLCL